jgi:uncharacterized protein (DUF433 family)
LHCSSLHDEQPTKGESAIAPAPHWLGFGIYTVPEAARLTRIPSARVRRWIRGYEYKTGEERRDSPPVFRRGFPQLGNALALSFRDLIEVRFVEAFRSQGVAWGTIRAAHYQARRLLYSDHPFATGRFLTDGYSIFASLPRDDAHATDDDVLNVITKQYAFQKVLGPYLKGLQFENDLVTLWWPLESSRRVVIDPERSFGQPIVSRASVPTAVIAAAYRAEGSYAKVSRWYEVDELSVRDAVKYEARLAA